MKKLLFLAGIISMLLIFGMALAGCDDGTNQIGVNNEAGPNSSTAVTDETSRATVTKPGIPSGLKVTGTTPSSIAISWSPVTGATGYKVWRSSSPSTGYTVVKTVSSSTTYTDTGLNANTLYYYKVSAYSSAGDSNQSSYVSAKTGTITKPNIPTGLKATATSPTTVTVIWSSATGATGYKVWRSSSPSSGYTVVKTVPSPTYMYTDTGLKANTQYYYKVSAYNSAGESNQSSYVSAKTLK